MKKRKKTKPINVSKKKLPMYTYKAKYLQNLFTSDFRNLLI